MPLADTGMSAECLIDVSSPLPRLLAAADSDWAMVARYGEVWAWRLGDASCVRFRGGEGRQVAEVCIGDVKSLGGKGGVVRFVDGSLAAVTLDGTLKLPDLMGHQAVSVSAGMCSVFAVLGDGTLASETTGIGTTTRLDPGGEKVVQVSVYGSKAVAVLESGRVIAAGTARVPDFGGRRVVQASVGRDTVYLLEG
eukprot:Hpha_TRINITY_DN31393_c0_g1::TRINITY_DN31393_c0_g1_i1::g.194551::m.194551